MENLCLLIGILNTLLTAASSATRITYTLTISYTKRGNFQAKQNRFFIKLMNVCFKRIIKKQKFLIWTLKKVGNLYCILCSFLMRLMISSLFYKLTYVRYKINFTAINKDCFKWDYSLFQKQPPEVFYKNLFLKISQHSPEMHVLSVSFS